MNLLAVVLVYGVLIILPMALGIVMILSGAWEGVIGIGASIFMILLLKAAWRK